MANSNARPWDIGEWLQGLGLGQYEAAFRQNEVNKNVLPKLTQDDLKEIGVGPVGHRRIILDAIETLRTGADAKAPPPEAPSTVPDRAKDTAERRQVTVMFSDLVGSTALSARMDPKICARSFPPTKSVLPRPFSALVGSSPSIWATGY